MVEFRRNGKFVWLGRFALFPLIWIGTDFSFAEEARGIMVMETLYFEMAPWWLLLFPVLGLRSCFTPGACKKHVRDELHGIKSIIESGDYQPRDVTYALEDAELIAMVKHITD